MARRSHKPRPAPQASLPGAAGRVEPWAAPLTAPPATASQTGETALHFGPGEGAATILVVSDRRDALDALVPSLARENYRVLTAPNAKAALDDFLRERAHVVVIDHQQLDTGGTELVRRVRALAPAVSIIVQSSALTPEQRRDLIRDLDVNAIHNDREDPERVLEQVACALAATRCFERMRAEQEVRSLILAKLCHNLRSPLHVIQGYVEVMRGDPAAASFDEILFRVAGAADNAIGLLQDYLDLARLEAPGLLVRREDVAIDELVAEMRGLASRQIGERPLRLTTSIQTAGAMIRTDGEKLRAILAQLMANAIKFTPEGHIHLAVRAVPGRTNFALADTGPGISDQDLGTLFAPFQQRPNESLASMPGQGIGLAIAQRLAALIGASLTARRGKHGGAVFTLSVPSAMTVRPLDAPQHTVH